MIAVGGEALIDLVVDGADETPHPGGGPFNTAVALGALGAPVAFVGGISTDDHGAALLGRLRDTGVDLRYVRRSSLPSPVARVTRGRDGSAHYDFRLKNTAYTDISAEGGPVLGDEVTALHVGTLALATDPPARYYEALLNDSGEITVIVDPNVRPAIFGDASMYRERFERWLIHADVVKLSLEDAAWIYPELADEDVLEHLLGLGPRLVALTLGVNGVHGATRQSGVSVDGYRVDVVDTVGAGDAFGAGLLHWLWTHGRLDRAALASLTAEDLFAALKAGAAVAALACTRAGAAASTSADVERFVKSFAGRG